MLSLILPTSEGGVDVRGDAYLLLGIQFPKISRVRHPKIDIMGYIVKFPLFMLDWEALT